MKDIKLFIESFKNSNAGHRGAFSEYLALNFYKEKGCQPVSIHKGLADFRIGDRKIDIKSNIRYIKKDYNNNFIFKSFNQRLCDMYSYEQIFFFSNAVIFIGDFEKGNLPEIYKVWSYDEIYEIYMNWPRKKTQGIKQEDSFGENIKNKIKSINDQKTIQRGGHIWSKNAQPFNSYPTEKEMLKFKSTTYIKWSVVKETGEEFVEYIIIFPHLENVLKTIRKDVIHNYIAVKKKKFIIDFLGIIENVNHYKNYHFKDETELFKILGSVYKDGIKEVAVLFSRRFPF
jgi:hypothetical protein